MTIIDNIGNVIKWQKSSDGGAWIDIANTEICYEDMPLSIGTWRYRAEVQNGECLSVYSEPVSIDVSSETVAGTLSGGGIVACHSTIGPMELTGYTGDIVGWQKEYLGGSWSDIPATVGLSTFTEAGGGSGTLNYRVRVQNGGCDELTSNIVTYTIMGCSDTLTYTGSVQTITVPLGVTEIDVECWGAAGGRGWINGRLGSSIGGLGGYSEGTLDL
jgi:hypothetical protein